MNCSFSSDDIKNADVNGDGVVDEADLARYQRLVDQRSQFDLNGDNWIDEKDIDRIAQVRNTIESLGADLGTGLLDKVDFNRDGFVDSRDLAVFERIYQDPKVLDLAGSSSVDATDIARLNEIIDFVEAEGVPAPGQIDRADIDGVGGVTLDDPLADGPTFATSTVTVLLMERI